MLYYGDAIEVMRGLADDSVDFICADPPYGILKHKIETVIDMAEYFRQCHRVLKPDCFNLYFGRQPTLTDWNSEAFKVFAYKQEIIWYKRQRSSPMNDMGRVYENIIVTMKGFRKFNDTQRPYTDVIQSLEEFRDKDHLYKMLRFLQVPYKSKMRYEQALQYLTDESQYTEVQLHNDTSSVGLKMSSEKMAAKGLKSLVNGVLPQNLISFISHNKQKRSSTTNENTEHNLKHPTVKPINMLEYIILLCCNEGNVVLDPFMGSGTTGIACINTGRNFIGVELDPGYFAMSQERITKANLGGAGLIISPNPLHVKAKPKLQLEMF